MKLGTGFLKATALYAVLILSGCNDEEDNGVNVVTQSVVQNTAIAEGDIIASLKDGIHRVTIPSSISGENEAQTHIIVKDRYKAGYGGYGYILNLGTFVSDSNADQIEVETIEEGDFIANLKDGIHQLNIGGRVFPDGKDRTFSIVKDRYKAGYGGYGYSTVLNSSVSPN